MAGSDTNGAIGRLKRDWRARYWRWVADYARYAKARGFTTEINDWPYVRRSFLECWAEPGFHRFWQVWNPGIAYFVYRLYLRLGGRRHRDLATIGAFLGCGLGHWLGVLPVIQRWTWMLPTTFLAFGLLTVASRHLAPILRQERWPWVLNAGVNVGLVLLSFDLGFRADRWLG